jgi:hypothetical protein
MDPATTTVLHERCTGRSSQRFGAAELPANAGGEEPTRPIEHYLQCVGLNARVTALLTQCLVRRSTADPAWKNSSARHARSPNNEEAGIAATVAARCDMRGRRHGRGTMHRNDRVAVMPEMDGDRRDRPSLVRSAYACRRFDRAMLGWPTWFSRDFTADSARLIRRLRWCELALSTTETRGEPTPCPACLHTVSRGHGCCRRGSRCPPTWWPRDARSRSRASPRRTRASGGPAHGGPRRRRAEATEPGGYRVSRRSTSRST